MARLGIPIERASLRRWCRKSWHRQTSRHGSELQQRHVHRLYRRRHRSSTVLVVLGNRSLAIPMVDRRYPTKCIPVQCQTMALRQSIWLLLRRIPCDDWFRLVCHRMSTFRTIPKCACRDGMDHGKWRLDANTSRNWCHRPGTLNYRHSSKLEALKIKQMMNWMNIPSHFD